MLVQDSLTKIIEDQTRRTLWEVKNVIDCIPNGLWNKLYGDMPLWKHVYHMLHSLDLWFINPRDMNYQEPSLHVKDLNNLDVTSEKRLVREDIEYYYNQIAEKIINYVNGLLDKELLEKPVNCEYAKFTLILAQYRHLHSHMGMIMGFIIDDTNQWPRVVGLEKEIPQGDYSKYF